MPYPFLKSYKLPKLTLNKFIKNLNNYRYKKLKIKKFYNVQFSKLL